MRPDLRSGHWPLILQMARRDVAARFRGSVMGALWLVLNPALTLAVYTFAFRSVFHVRWSGQQDSPMAFALNLFAGLIFFNLLAGVANRAPRLLLEQPHLITKMVFPLETLAWSLVLSEYFYAGISLALLLGVSWASGTPPTSALLYLPVVVLCPLPLLLGLAWALSGFGIYLRDLPQIVAPFLSLLIFLSPVFYPVQALPPALQPWMALNPLTVPMEALRTLLFSGQAPSPGPLAGLLFAGLAVAWAGRWLFGRLRQGFADVL